MRALNEPTSYFLLIALALFLIEALGQMGNQESLVLSQQELDARIFRQELARGEELSEEQRELLTDAFIEEQLLVIEAKKLGLDDDSRIHNILAQKMRHVLSRDVIQPDEAELIEFYQNNVERYQQAETFDFDELVFNTRGSLDQEVQQGLSAGWDSARLLQLEPGGAAPLNGVTEVDLRNIFEPQFALSAIAAESGSWVGPFASNRGQHWLKKVAQRDARQPELSEIRDRLRLDWIALEEDQRLQQSVAKLRQGYRIEFSSDGAGADHE